MKKLTKFLARKLKRLGNNLFSDLFSLFFLLVIFVLMALPGVIIAFLVGITDTDTIATFGISSFFVISAIILIVSKVVEIIKEYKSFDEIEEC